MEENRFENPDQDPRNKRSLKEGICTFVTEHKILTFLSLFLVLAVIILLIQSFTKKEYDVFLLYAGPTYANQADLHNSMVSSVSDLCITSKDRVSISSIVWVPDRLVEKYSREDLYYNGASNAEALQSFHYALAAGDYSILLIDPELYQKSSDLDIFVSLDELGVGDAARIDAYALKLSDLSLYTKPGFSSLPEDTLLVLRKQSFIQTILTNQKKRAQLYSKQVEAFKLLVQ